MSSVDFRPRIDTILSLKRCVARFYATALRENDRKESPPRFVQRLVTAFRFQNTEYLGVLYSVRTWANEPRFHHAFLVVQNRPLSVRLQNQVPVSGPNTWVSGGKTYEVTDTEVPFIGHPHSTIGGLIRGRGNEAVRSPPIFFFCNIKTKSNCFVEY